MPTLPMKLSYLSYNVYYWYLCVCAGGLEIQKIPTIFWIYSYPFVDFSLLEWKYRTGLPLQGPMEYPYTSIFLDDLGLSWFMEEERCAVNASGQLDTGLWIK